MSEDFKVKKTEAEWRAELSPEQYHVTREHGTERAFTHPLNVEKRNGVYHCVACGQPLFDASTKYDSGSGWPSFFAPISPDAVGETVDRAHGMVRTEIHCSNCGAHLGHVFSDGPRPSGLRYCMNGTALDFEPKP
jgi:peptide-methionine (R)-S-oxide reductase